MQSGELTLPGRALPYRHYLAAGRDVVARRKGLLAERGVELRLQRGT